MVKKFEKFDWSSLGDITLGRSNLGQSMPVVVYRLMQYTVIDELRDRYGEDVANDIIRSAGFRAGVAFAQNVLEPTDDFSTFISNLQMSLKELSIGILRIEKADLEKLDLVLTVSEDLDCSGLPVTDDSVCVYDEGFIGGLLYNFTGKIFEVREVDCWATGDRTCRFVANVAEA
ncbi:MAG: 4-vinyl reductase [Leptospirales bacterium]|nr:4-vinyl reductase [Leptospirales bacterium]